MRDVEHDERMAEALAQSSAPPPPNLPEDAIAIVSDGHGGLKLDVPDFTCPACGHTAPYGNAKGELLRCSECTSRIAFGVAQPRVFVEPAEDRRFVRLRFETWQAGEWTPVYDVTVDKDFGKAIWHNVQSIC